MNRRKEKKLIEMAFGDVDRVVDSMDAKELGKLGEFTALSRSLKGLQSVPDHQLSNERLREAILRGGLQAKKEPEQRSEGSWSIPALGVCAVALVVFLGSHFRTSKVTPVMDPSIDHALAATSKKLEFELPPLKSPGEGGRIAMSTAPIPPTDSGLRVRLAAASFDSSRKVHSRRHGRKKLDERLDPNWLTLSMGDQESGSVGSGTKSPENSITSASVPDEKPTALSDVSSSPDSKPLVEIDQAQDQQTGARLAKEVESRNVVVGG